MAISQNFPNESPTLVLNFASSRKLDPRITFTRSSIATYVDEDKLIKTARINEARFDHDPVTGECKGLLIEEDRTNLITQSNTDVEFSNASTGNTWTSSESAPDGSLTAKICTTNNRSFKEYTSSSVNAVVSTFSIYLKWTGSIGVSTVRTFDLRDISSDTVRTTSSITLTNNWQRFSISGTVQSNGIRVEISGGISSVSAWGAQLEVGSFPTSYIPTSGSTVTRFGDLAFIDIKPNSWYNYSQGSLVFQHSLVPYATGALPGYPAVGFAQTNGSSSNSIQYFFTKNGGGAQYLVRDSGVDQTTLDVSGGTGSGVIASKVGFSYATNSFIVARNGSQVGVTTSGVVPQSIGTLLLGTNSKNSTNNINACISNVVYYSKSLSSSRLQNLTK